MIKTLKTLFKQDREKFIVPKSVQAVIPLKTMWEDGIFLVGRNKYAKTFKFEDINYAVASREDKEAMFLEYSELLNALDSGATTKITINNRRLNKADFEQTILIPMAEDDLDKYRKEYNKMLLDKATGANSTVQDKYVTVSVCKKNIEEARNYFARVGADLIGHFNRLGSKCTELDANDKLTSTARARKRRLPLTWRRPCGKDTTSRTISAPTPLSLRKIILRWATATGVLYSSESTPPISRTAWWRSFAN